MTAPAPVRRLVEFTPAHKVVSVYVDLDPGRFATPAARASEINSLLDGAGRDVDSDTSLDHEQRAALREDLERLRKFLEDPPTQGARSIALFCCSREGLFETLTLTRPVTAQVVIASRPHVEPLLEAAREQRWLVALVSQRTARFLYGDGDRFEEQRKVESDVHGHHSKGGWSQANYERSAGDDAEHHFQEVADLLGASRRAGRFDRLVLGGTSEDIARVRSRLDGETSAALVDTPLAVEVEHATASQVSEAMHELVEFDERNHERAALDRLQAEIAADGHGVGGPEQTVEALNERRVETLLLAPEFNGSGGRCPTCGLLTLDADQPCPVDGTPVEPVALREACVELAVLQDADVLFVTRHPDLGPWQGIGAQLRF